MTAPTLSAALDCLFATIEARQGTDAAHSYTARLMAAGTAKIAQKLGEEAVETLIEAMRGDRKRLVSESADLLYHLLVLWADAGVTPDEVGAELARRHAAKTAQQQGES